MTELVTALLIGSATYIFIGGIPHLPRMLKVKIGTKPKYSFRKQNSDQEFIESLWQLKSELSTGVLGSLSNLNIPKHKSLSQLELIIKSSNETGAAITPTINRLIKQLKNQIDLKQQVSAELASTKATVIILASLPIFGLFLSSLLSGNSINWLFGTPVGRWCLIGGLTLNLFGIVWLNRIIKKSLEVK